MWSDEPKRVPVVRQTEESGRRDPVDRKMRSDKYKVGFPREPSGWMVRKEDDGHCLNP